MNSVARDINTVIEPSVPMADDVAAINAGRATPGRTGNGQRTWTINGRTYSAHENGTLVPREGSGFMMLDRGAYKALGVYNEHGLTPRAESILDRMGSDSTQRAAARLAHLAGRGDQ